MTKEVSMDVYIHHMFEMVGDYVVIPSIDHAQISIHTYLKKYINETNRKICFDGIIEQSGKKEVFHLWSFGVYRIERGAKLIFKSEDNIDTIIFEIN